MFKIQTGAKDAVYKMVETLVDTVINNDTEFTCNQANRGIIT